MKGKGLVVVDLDNYNPKYAKQLRYQGACYIGGRGKKDDRWALRLLRNKELFSPDINIPGIKVDIFCHRSSARLVIVLHGGFRKSAYQRDLKYELSSVLANDSSLAVCNLEYPSALDGLDCDQVCEYLLDQIERIHHLICSKLMQDVMPIHLLGHSAGGFYTLSLAGLMLWVSKKEVFY